VGGQSHSKEVVLHRQEDLGVDAVVHPLRLDVVPKHTAAWSNCASGLDVRRVFPPRSGHMRASGRRGGVDVTI